VARKIAGLKGLHADSNFPPKRVVIALAGIQQEWLICAELHFNACSVATSLGEKT
jgi:hypothetical protein